ncbi:MULTISPECIES: ECF transporter S component [Lactobacillaceae]|uniref:ECF transporter S component n=1 Tax=Lactobacillaceae TaxID=33958 RepID=UPI000C1B70FA|nr:MULTISPECIES: ECF transporter S component [Lactobacillaceae]
MNIRIIIMFIVAFVSLAAVSFFERQNYLLISILFLSFVLILYFVKFEKKAVSTRELVFIAIICALAVGGRIAFAELPSVKPELFILILGSMVAGSETGFLMGTIIALTSNMYFGQGAWTPWQMFSMGLIGLISGLISNHKINRYMLTLWGFLAGFLMGWIMDVYYILGFVSSINLQSIGLAFVGSFYFDLAHALFTAILLFIFGKPWSEKFNYYKKKYQLFMNE